MVDVAQLGIQVKSEGAQKAIAELRQLEQIGRRAGSMADAMQGQTQAASRGLMDLERSASRAHASLGRMLGLSVGAAFGTLTAGLVKAKNEILELAKVAEDNRLRPEFLSGLFGEAGRGGASQREITKALSHFSDVSKQTRDDAETLYKAMTNISPALAKAFESAPTQEERLRLISEALKTTTDEVKRLQLAQEAFGTDSERILRVLGAGRDALSEYERAARATGMAVDQDMIAKARQADQVLSNLATVISANLRAALVELAPVIAYAAQQLGPLATEALRIISAITGAQGLATTSTLRTRREQSDIEIAQLQEHAARLGESRRLADVEQVREIEKEIARIRARTRDVDTELSNRGEYDDPRDRRSQASTRFRMSGGLGAAPPAFRARPDLSSSGSGSSSDTTSSYDRALRQLEERNALARKELETMGLTTAQRESSLALERAINIAKRDGTPLTEEQLQKLRAQSEEYGRIQAQLEQTKKLMRELRELSDFARSTVSGLFTDTLSGIQQGRGVWESFAQAAVNALNKISNKLAEMAINGLWEAAFPSSGGGGGLFGALLNGVFGSFGGGGDKFAVKAAHGEVFRDGNVIPFAKGGIIDRPTVFGMSGGRTGLAGEAGTEGIFPIRRMSNGDLGVAAANSNQPQSISLTVVVEGANGDQHVMDLVRQGVEAGMSQVQANIVPTVREGLRRGALR